MATGTSTTASSRPGRRARSPMDGIDLSVLTIGLAVLALLVAVAGVQLYASGRAERRALLDRLAGPEPAAADARPLPILARPGAASGAGEPAQRPRTRRFTGLDRRLRGTALGRRLRLKLQATGMDLTVGEYAGYVI